MIAKTIPFPESLKAALKRITLDRRYPVVAEILDRGKLDELSIESAEEAQMIVDVARLEMLSASLKFPFWDDDSPRYDRFHDEAFQEVQMGFFEKVVMYVSQEFDVVTRP